MNKQIEDHELANLVDQLAAANETLATKVAILQAENKYLRRINRVQPHVRLVQRANAGAKKMAMLHLAGYLTGRQACRAAGISERTYFAARAMCQLARIHDGQQFVTNDAALIEERLSGALAFAVAHPDALAARMPRSRRPR